MARRTSTFTSLTCLCLLILFGATGGAQERAAAPPLAATAAPLAPEVLPAVLAEGAAALERAAAQLKETQTQARQSYEQAGALIQELKGRGATLKASLAVGEVPVARAESELKALTQGEERLNAVIKELAKQQEKAAQERQAKIQARATLQEEMAKLEKSRHPISRSPELRQTFSRFLALAADYEKEAAKLQEHLDKWLKALESGQQELAASREQIAALLQRAWWEKLLTRSTYVALIQQVGRQITETWEALLALPTRLSQLFSHTLRSGALAGYLLAKAGPLLGLALFLVIVAVFAFRLGNRLTPPLQEMAAQAEELGLKVILCGGSLLTSHLLALGLLAWLATAFWTLSLVDLPEARLTLLAGLVITARKLARSLIARVFAGPAAQGILPLDEVTAKFYRRNLRRLSSYILLFGVFGLNSAKLLGFSPGSQEFLSYVFQVGLLGWTAWILRPSSFETLVFELPVPAWFQHRGVLRTLRSLMFTVLTAIIISGLLGFQGLSVYLAQAAAATGLVIVLAWLVWQVVRAAVKFVLHPQRGRLAGRVPLRQDAFQRSYRTIINGLLALFWLLTTVTVLQFWGIQPRHLRQAAEYLTYGPRVGSVHLTPLTVGSAILIGYLGFWLSRLLRTFLEVNIFPRLDWDKGVCYTISATLHYVVLIITILLALNTLGFPLANLALVAGALGVGIGFGLQNIVNNFISGLILLFERPIKVGDLLVVDGQWGTVKEIRVRSTIFQTADRAVLIIPNSELLSSKIVNWTHTGRGVNRLTLKVGVAYGSDVRRVTEIINGVCRSHPRVLADPPPQIYFEAFGDSALHFTVWVFLGSPRHRTPVTHELNSAILTALTEHGIVIPFPQREIIIKSWPADGGGGPS